MNTEDRQNTLLIVDDAPENINVIKNVFKDIYKIKAATSGERALEIANSDEKPDLILLDIVMPGMNGYETIKRLKSNPDTAAIPVIFLTSKTESEDERTGFDLGAVDYITKPINPAILFARVDTQISLKRMRDELIEKNRYLEEEVEKRTKEISVIQDVTIMAMGSLAEMRDNETGNHIRRTQYYVKILAEYLSNKGHFKDTLSPENIKLLFKSAPLHDIGKIGIPDKILLKPGKLTPEEFEIMKEHTTIGRDALIAAESLLDVDSSFLRFAREITFSHHEWYNGNGYPQGLSGDDIPVSARLMAIADVYDATRSKRIYKPSKDHNTAVNEILAEKGTHFDPIIVDAFIRLEKEFEKIALQFSDDSVK
ncbi:MAG: two-component system response regulator [Deltaproteobacteria bacterium]|nr:two-component system response regulator [Deltaproteobacteria bacterium]